MDRRREVTDSCKVYGWLWSTSNDNDILLVRREASNGEIEGEMEGERERNGERKRRCEGPREGQEEGRGEGETERWTLRCP